MLVKRLNPGLEPILAKYKHDNFCRFRKDSINNFVFNNVIIIAAYWLFLFFLRTFVRYAKTLNIIITNMSKIHITLVGAQPMPIYLGIKYCKPDSIVFVHSQETLDVANRVKKEIDCKNIEMLPMKEVDLYKIYITANDLLKKYKNDEVTVNISGGLKSWSHIIGSLAQAQENCCVIYVDQNNIVSEFNTLKSIDITEESADIDAHLRLYGNELASFNDFDEYTNDDYLVASEIEKLRQCNSDVFKNLFAVINDRKIQSQIKNKKGNNYCGRSYVEWYSENNNDVITGEFYNQFSTDSIEFDLKSPHAISIAFNSGWFEYKVANMLSSWHRVKELRMNCVFPLNKRLDKNEVDIIADLGNKLLFVECKTKLYNPTDLDKFRAVVRAYGGTGAKALFITHSKWSEQASVKCKEHGIIYYPLQDSRGRFHTDRELIEALEKNINTINAR